MKLLEKTGLRAEYATEPHKRQLQKPNEDRLFCDEEKGIFIVLDGVTRVHAEYEFSPYESAAAEVGEIFIKAVKEYIYAHLDCESEKAILIEAVRVGNRKIKEYREKKTADEWIFYPSTLGIISLYRDGRLHYVAVGDCLGVLLRGRSKILFGRELSLAAVDLLAVSKAERYALYCNHPETKLSYTVFNGDDQVMDTIDYSYIDLHEDDTLILATDGISEYLRYEKAEVLREQTPRQMIDNSAEFDKPPFAKYADDKTLIKISL